MPKYQLTSHTKQLQHGEETIVLHQIQALKSFTNTAIGLTVNKGDLGGWVQSEENLSQEGLCWVKGEACVYEQARVLEHALVLDQAQVYGQAIVQDEVLVGEDASVKDSAILSDSCMVFGNAIVGGKTRVTEEALITEGAFHLESYHNPLTDTQYPTINHLRDPDHPRYDARLAEQPADLQRDYATATPR